MNEITKTVRGAAGRLLVALTLLLLTSGLVAEAQTRIPREIHVGVIGGGDANLYTFYPKSHALSQKWTTGYTGGVAVRYIEETLFGLQAELHLTQRAFADDFEQQEDWKFERRLTYIEMPIMAHVYFQIGKHHEVAFDAGPKIAWFQSDAVESSLPAEFGQPGNTYYGRTAHHTLPIEHKFDYGIQAGLGYEFKFNQKLSMQLQGRFYYGLGNLWPDSKADDFEQSSAQSIQVVASLWWHHVIRGKKVKRPQGRR